MNILKNKLTKSIVAACLSLSLGTSVSTQSYAQDVGPALKPIFLDTCSAGQRKVLLKAYDNFSLMLDDALNGATEEFDSVEFRESFGTDDNDPGHDFEVLGRLLLLRMGANLLQMEVSCLPDGDPECDGGVVAYVPDQKLTERRFEHRINFCPTFFNATQAHVQNISAWTKVSEYQGGTIMHEHAHLSWATKELLEKAGMKPASWVKDQEKAVDLGYNVAGVKKLAKEDPAEAILNADAYHMFVMRLAIRKGKIYK